MKIQLLPEKMQGSGYSTGPHVNLHIWNLIHPTPETWQQCMASVQ